MLQVSPDPNPNTNPNPKPNRLGSQHNQCSGQVGHDPAAPHAAGPCRGHGSGTRHYTVVGGAVVKRNYTVVGGGCSDEGAL